MKTFYNKTLVSALALSMLIAPSISFAANDKSNKEKKGGFCTRIDTTASRLSDQLSKKTEAVDKNKNKHFSKLEEKRETRDEKRGGTWASQDNSHNVRIGVLTRKANTDLEKAAVVTFDKALDSAVAKRRDATDAAVKAYRLGVDAIVKGSLNTIDANVLALKKSVDEAISTAKTSCANGVSDEAVRVTMQNSIKAAYEKMKTSRTDSEIKLKLEALNKTRLDAVDSALKQFKADVEKATTDLKTAFQKK